jgi:8-oxo-dGTP diphosphatase
MEVVVVRSASSRVGALSSSSCSTLRSALRPPAIFRSSCIPAAACSAPSFSSSPHVPHVHPRVGVAMCTFPSVDGVIDATHVALIRRGKEPGKGLWCLPGGRQELGEPLALTAVRELEEETGLRALPVDDLVPGFAATDAIYPDPKEGKPVSYHYAIVHVLAHVPLGGAGAGVGGAGAQLASSSSSSGLRGPFTLPHLQVGDDAMDAAWARIPAPAGSSKLTVGSPSSSFPLLPPPGQRVLDASQLERDGVLVGASLRLFALAQAAMAMRGYRLWAG